MCVRSSVWCMCCVLCVCLMCHMQCVCVAVCACARVCVPCVSDLHVLDGLRHVPPLVGVDHECEVWPDLLAYDAQSFLVLVQRHAHLGLEVRPPLLDPRATLVSQLLLGVAQPARAGGVRRVALVHELGQPLLLPLLHAGEHLQRLLRGQRVSDPAEVDERHHLSRAHVIQQTPHRLPHHLTPQVPHGVHHRAHGHVHHTLLRTQPAQLTVVHQRRPPHAHVGGDRLQRTTLHEVL